MLRKRRKINLKHCHRTKIKKSQKKPQLWNKKVTRVLKIKKANLNKQGVRQDQRLMMMLHKLTL